MTELDPANTAATAVWRIPAMRRLVLVTFLGFTSFCLTLSSLPSFAAAGGASGGTAGLVTTVMLVCTVATQTLVPAAVQRCGLGPVLALGLLALGLPSPLYLVNDELWWLLLVSAVRGLGFAVLTVLGSTMTARIAPRGQVGEAIGLYGLAIALPNLLAVPGGVALQSSGHFSFVALLAASPVLAVPFVPALARQVSPAPSGAVGAHSSRAAVRAVAVPSLMLLAVTLAGGGLLTFLPIAAPAGALAAVALLIFGATGAIARWAVGLAADQMGVRLLLPLSLLASVGGLATVGLALVSGSGLGSNAALLLGAAVFGVGYGATQNLTLVAALASTPHDNIASAVWNIGFDAGTALGALTVGLVAATGLGLPWTFVASTLLIVAVLPFARGQLGRRGR